MKQIIARFNSKCSETGKTLKKGDTIYYDSETKKAYHVDSKKVKDYIEAENTAGYVQAQEDAYWDNVTGGYYSR